MRVETLVQRIRQCPLVASVQASDKAVDHPETLLRLARASADQGVRVLRLQGLKNIRTIKGALPMPVIGLIKRRYEGFDVLITPAEQDIDTLADLGCEAVALDATDRPRPYGGTVAALIQHAHRRKAIAMADCDTLEAALAAEAAGADLIGTTLAGYTPARAPTDGPDLELLRAICSRVKVPVLAEGRYSQPWEVQAALRIGAIAVVVGGALNDPAKNTRNLLPPKRPAGNIGAVDIGGTWLRFGVFTPDWELVTSERVPNPPTREERLAWIRARAEEHGVVRLGIGTGGVVDPRTGEVWTAKEYLMPDQIGIVFDEGTLGLPTIAWGDGHATAWGHACLPQFAGRRVATLALGTGVGCGFVQDGQIWSGPRGEYPRLNDLPAPGGETYEALMGGLHLGAAPTEGQRQQAVSALEGALSAIRGMYFPDEIVVGGSVGLSPWMAPHLERLGVAPSPFGGDAGLYGAAAVALFEP